MFKAQPTKGRREDGVKVEFVYCDGARDDVQLSGDWTDWRAIQMFHEGGGMWSVVTPVPPGAHEFKFIVDGEWKHSNRHPTIGIDETSLNNVRVVLPEPRIESQKTIAEPPAGSIPLSKTSRAGSRASDTGSTTGSATGSAAGSAKGSSKSKTSGGSTKKSGGLFRRR
uniref:AMP-activated protein kinase glycogen-binding domain-containing protein n=1 Tax=Rhodosorus marinus TaxID=101924 RepID=A0A7S3A0W2_9RHOD|mmetsp:Transcript_36667/g.146582  ORF Transcript_36667/g.146582 Transcript_36667/m.146582 type:complete len:168 (+) Transcript_36667:250-753(+)